MTEFSKSLLPIRFPPKEDELFSSWLVRLSTAYVLKLHSFTKSIFQQKEVWNRDIDKSADLEHLVLIKEKTAISTDILFNSTLRSFTGKLYETHNADGNLTWVMPVGVFHRSRHKFGLQICPLCLAEDKEPYYRKLWRLSWVTVCTKHQTILLDRCPGCKNPIIFHRGDMGWRNQFVSYSNARCSYCDLYWTSNKVINGITKAEKCVVSFQQKLNDSLTNGWFDLNGFGLIHSINFFNGLKNLLRILTLSKKSGDFRELVKKRSDLLFQSDVVENEQARYFDGLSVRSRYAGIALAEWVLSEWSHRFVEIALTTETYSSVFLTYNENLPFWYWSPINEFLTKKTHPIAHQEIWSALEYLENTSAFITLSKLEKLMGRNFLEYSSDRTRIKLYERIKKFNLVSETRRLQTVRLQAKNISLEKSNVSKNERKRLYRQFVRENSKPPERFNQTQTNLEYLIFTYKRRERLKMAKRMEKEQNAVLVAKEFGVSPQIITKWYRRYKSGGVENLDDYSKAPKTFRHQIVFEQEENWIRILHSEGLELLEIKDELFIRYKFQITEGGLYRVLRRLNLILPCSKNHRFVKKNRKKSASTRNYSQRRILS